MDAFLCCSCLCREHSKIWIATIILGEYSSYVFHEFPMKHLFFPKHWLPGLFQACVLSPSLKGEKKVRSILDGLGDSSNRQVYTLKIFYYMHLVSHFEECQKLLFDVSIDFKLGQHSPCLHKRNQGYFPRELPHGMNFCEDGTGPCQPLIKCGLPDRLLDQWLA